VLVVTAAETIGYLAPAMAGIAVFRADLSLAALSVIVAAAAFFEGAALGTGQAYALPFRIRRLRFALLTAVAAVLAWLPVLPAMMFPLAFVPIAAAVGGCAIGWAQWLELRHYRAGARRWIVWTVLARTLALPLGLVPGSLVMIDVGLNGGSTPFAVHLALCGAGGLVMAAVVAVIGWHGVKRLGAPGSGARPRGCV
jgi:hypothetical protein